MSDLDIVVGIKDKQPAALKFAADAAQARGVGLRVVHSLDLRVAGDFVSVPHDTWEKSGEQLLDTTRDLLRGLGATVHREFVLSTRSAYLTLRDEAKRAALVVVGTDTPGWGNRLFRGSVTERLATHSPAPLAIVPEKSWPGDAQGDVVVAIDARGAASGPLRFAFSEADRRGSALQVIHVVPLDSNSTDALPERVGVAEVLAGWTQEFPDVKVTTHLLFDEPDDGCVRVSSEADLLVLGRCDTKVPLPFAHPVLAQVIGRAHCPSVVVPAQWEAAGQ